MHSTGELTLDIALRHRAATAPGCTFIIWEAADGTRVERSYGWVSDQVDRLVAGLLGNGVKPGERVIVHSANRPEAVIAMLALNRLGAVAVPTIVQYKPDELSYVVGHCKAVAVISDPARVDTVEQAVQGRDVRLLVSMGDAHDSGWLSWQQATEQLPDGPPALVSSVEETGIVMYSSGTTARPKGIELSNRALMASAETNAEHQRLQPQDRWLCIVPVFHVNGLLISTMSTLVTGSSIVLVEEFSFERYLSQLRIYRATVAFVPAMVARRLLLEPERPDDVEHHLRLMLYGMPLSQEECDAFERRFKVPLVNLWGMTENAGLGTRTPLYLPRRSAAIGLPMLGSEMRLFGEDGKQVAPGEPGKAHYRGAGLASGYLDDPKATAETFDDGWVDTHDIMVADELGYLSFLDRDKDMIKVKAENVASSEVERVLLEHESVAEAAVVGLPDERLGERVVAFVVPEPGCEIDAGELRIHAERLLARFKLPREVHAVEELPKTSTLKVRKAQLRKLAEEKA